MDYLFYLRKDKLPHIWCEGCGNGIVLKSLLRAIHSIGWDKDKIAVVSGIGCSSRTPGYLDFNTLHTTHGRAIAFATGLKLARPDLNVIVITGDGDATAIGGNHFIHAARRNIDLTVLVYNNYIYGMTGGQFSPTTPTGRRGSTAPYGNLEQNFDPTSLAIAAGAAYVARSTVYHVDQLDKMIKGALDKRGFSLVEVISNCHTYYGRLNREGDPVKMLEWQKKHAMPVQAARKLPPEKLEGKWITGVLHHEIKSEFTDNYAKLRARLAAQK